MQIIKSEFNLETQITYDQAPFSSCKFAYLKPIWYLLISEFLWDLSQGILISVLLNNLSPPSRDTFHKE